jgi:hypothetical protein
MLRDNNLWEFINVSRDSYNLSASSRQSSVKSNNESIFQWELNQVRIWSHHFFLYNFRSLLSVDFAYKRWIRKKFFVYKKFFKKCNLRFFDRFWESWDDEKSLATHVLCESIASSDTEAELRNHVMWLRWLCIERNNFDSSISIYTENCSS